MFQLLSVFEGMCNHPSERICKSTKTSEHLHLEWA